MKNKAIATRCRTQAEARVNRHALLRVNSAGPSGAFSHPSAAGTEHGQRAQTLKNMHPTLFRATAVSCLTLLASGCAVVPGDPYYDPPRTVYTQPGPVYSSPAPIYSTPAYPAYPPTTVVPVPVPTPGYGYRYDRDRDHDWRERERERERWRAQRDYDSRMQREQNERLQRERQQAWQAQRDQAQREQAQRQAQREQMERERRQREESARRPPPQIDRGDRSGPPIIWRDRSRAENAN